VTHDFIVIGAGIAGASVAYYLSDCGRVCIVERERQPGIHATGRSAALYAPCYGGCEIRALTRASAAFFEDPPAGFADQALLAERGFLYIARADQTARLHQIVEEMRRSGGEIREVSAAEASARVPQLRGGYVATAAFDRQARDINVDILHRAFLRCARAAGVDLRTGADITRARLQGDAWWIELEDGVIGAPVVINAAGAWADVVAAIFGARPLGLQPLRRTAVIVDPPAGVDVRSWPTVMDADEEFYFKPDAGRLLLSPADETLDEPSDAQPTELDIAIAVDRVQSALELEVRRVRASWAGLRTFAPDRVPVVGFDSKAPGFFWCAGQGGYGLQTAPALGRAAASLAQHRSLPANLLAEGLNAVALSPGRFA
jgi:D-arginine dehydrogenase